MKSIFIFTIYAQDFLPTYFELSRNRLQFYSRGSQAYSLFFGILNSAKASKL